MNSLDPRLLNLDFMTNDQPTPQRLAAAVSWCVMQLSLARSECSLYCSFSLYARSRSICFPLPRFDATGTCSRSRSYDVFFSRRFATQRKHHKRADADAFQHHVCAALDHRAVPCVSNAPNTLLSSLIDWTNSRQDDFCVSRSVLFRTASVLHSCHCVE